MSRKFKRFIYNLRWGYHDKWLKIGLNMMHRHIGHDRRWELWRQVCRKHIDKRKDMLSKRTKELGLV